ncbi:MAG TPA: hypothetical protein VIC56_06815 [Gemmatimonadota bacterium]|jgi:hypothetical protein
MTTQDPRTPSGDGVPDEDRPADEKLVPEPAPGLGPIGPAGDPAYMEGTLRGRGPRVGLIVVVLAFGAAVVAAVALLLR